ncbi:DUF5818 domain-containing protein [Micromonospora sp. WMMD1082]|uniref:DUF5818 domain-containing protein n=1 Tax=Micromonospora sp. WMMD1082 TaxID=3016104 RepID=UPI002417CF45|nr:DUF5818 domain-containing protein [Micromonospora sp. WMMD1082]MDG4795345.1 hypothetical protein [Micromonospora sp. WMMD1082]
MPTTLRARVPTACLAALLVLAGCGDPNGGTVTAEQSPTGAGSPPAEENAGPGPTGDATGGTTGQPPDGRTGATRSPTEPPLIGTPTAPPSQPTELRRANVLAGRLSHGGSGPCYTLVTDDGREYALHGTGKGTFATGTWVRVTTGPAPDGVDCGPGIPRSILKISPVG